MKQEASMGRRPITRADEGEVRRRVAPRGYTVAVDNGEDGHVWIAGFWGDGPDRETRAALAPVGIFPGPDGWEIEDARPVAVRRKLPAPWAWWSCDAPRFAHLSQTGKLDDCVAQAWPNEAIIYHKGYRKGIDSRFDAASLEAARERAEDECWARGLFGVSDAPPVDREQAIRETLIAALAEGWSDETDLRRALLNRDLGSIMSEALWRALASIGAVKEGHRWRLSDGPPPGWEWVEQGAMMLKSTDRTRHAANVYSGGDWYVYPLDADKDGHTMAIDSDGRRGTVQDGMVAALLACRKAGLFAPREPTVAKPDPLPLSEPSADPAARALLRMFSVATGIGIDGTREGHPDTTPMQRIQQVARLCDSFVAEMRAGRDVEIARLASVAGPDRHSLVDYLTEHHADTWHANETAGAFAVRLLRSADDTIETLRREAEGADAARAIVAKERDAALDEVRAGRELSAREKGRADCIAAGLDQAHKFAAIQRKAIGELRTEREAAIESSKAIANLLQSAEIDRDAARMSLALAREERDRFERLHAAAEATAGEIEVELGKAKTKLVQAAEDVAAMRAALARTEQLLSGKVGT